MLDRGGHCGARRGECPDILKNHLLALDNQRGHHGAAYTADIRHGDRAAGEIGSCEFARRGKGLQAGDLVGDLEDGEGGDVVDDRDEEARRRIHCDADVMLGAHYHHRLGSIGVGGEARVERGMLREHQGHGFDDEREVGEFRSARGAGAEGGV